MSGKLPQKRTDQHVTVMVKNAPENGTISLDTLLLRLARR